MFIVYVALQQTSWTYWQLVAWSIISMQNPSEMDILNILMCKFEKFFKIPSAYFTKKM